ncbi:uncharacterized protein LOC106658656 [Trichogramma pretiosum]|uniref:uncharacterized protein LOC106658656 n=1 Tax=Trichogramma pretiosum TaxID=7493 RepID=UPI0006C9D8F1|nr:uncharacterized protein LOC106658656 [Trichogramma pretiosum]
MNYLMGVKDPSIRKWLTKGYKIKNNNLNERKEHLRDDQQKKNPTPAKKRSSLARPVRVHDSFSQENAPIYNNWNDDQSSQNQKLPQQSNMQIDNHEDTKVDIKIESKNEKKIERKIQPFGPTIDDVVEIQVDEEVTTWPLRLKLGDFLDFPLPKCHRRKRHRRRLMMIATVHEKTMKSMLEAGGIKSWQQMQKQKIFGFKDTERLLNVFSTNNVDQNNGYNFIRCSVM